MWDAGKHTCAADLTGGTAAGPAEEAPDLTAQASQREGATVAAKMARSPQPHSRQ